MRFSKASSYALLAVLYIAKHGRDNLVHGRVIANSYSIPLEFLLKILQQLARGRVLLSERGSTGGFRLRRPPSETTVLDIVEAVDGVITGELAETAAMRTLVGTKNTIQQICDQSSQFTRSLLRTTNIEQLLALGVGDCKAASWALSDVDTSLRFQES